MNIDRELPYFGTDEHTPLVFLDDALKQLGVTYVGLEDLLRHGKLARPGKLGDAHPSGHLVAWLQSDIDACMRSSH